MSRTLLSIIITAVVVLFIIFCVLPGFLAIGTIIQSRSDYAQQTQVAESNNSERTKLEENPPITLEVTRDNCSEEWKTIYKPLIGQKCLKISLTNNWRHWINYSANQIEMLDAKGVDVEKNAYSIDPLCTYIQVAVHVDPGSTYVVECTPSAYGKTDKERLDLTEIVSQVCVDLKLNVSPADQLFTNEPEVRVCNEVH